MHCNRYLCFVVLLCSLVSSQADSMQYKKSSTQNSGTVRKFVKAVSTVKSVECADGTLCPDTNTCCPFVSDPNKYGCCAETQGVCCSQTSAARDTCCPQSNTCCPTEGCCGQGTDCCADGGCCQTGHECCGQNCCNSGAGAKCCGSSLCCGGECCSDGSCCPNIGSTCCADFCCPANYRCCDSVNVPGCCSGLDSVCCDDGMCCPAGSTCCGVNSCCSEAGDVIKDIVLPHWVPKQTNRRQNS